VGVALMGEFKNGSRTKIVCWVLAVVVIIINVYLIVSFITDARNPVPHTAGAVLCENVFPILITFKMIFMCTHVPC
jgi:hypothetical protein